MAGFTAGPAGSGCMRSASGPACHSSTLSDVTRHPFLTSLLASLTQNRIVPRRRGRGRRHGPAHKHVSGGRPMTRHVLGRPPPALRELTAVLALPHLRCARRVRPRFHCSVSCAGTETQLSAPAAVTRAKTPPLEARPAGGRAVSPPSSGRRRFASHLACRWRKALGNTGPRRVSRRAPGRRRRPTGGSQWGTAGQLQLQGPAHSRPYMVPGLMRRRSHRGENAEFAAARFAEGRRRSRVCSAAGPPVAIKDDPPPSVAQQGLRPLSERL